MVRHISLAWILSRYKILVLVSYLFLSTSTLGTFLFVNDFELGGPEHDFVLVCVYIEAYFVAPFQQNKHIMQNQSQSRGK